MIVFGIISLSDVFHHRENAVFGSFIFGIVLILVGGGLLSSTIAETIHRLRQK